MKWTSKSFESVLSDETGGNIKTLQSDFLPVGRFPVIDQGKDFIAGYSDDDGRVCNAELPVIIFGDHTKSFKFIDFPFCLGADGTKVLRPRNGSDPKYLYHFLRQVQLPDAGYSRHFKYLREVEIPLPPLPEQRRIAAILDAADALLQKRRQALRLLDQLSQSIFIEMFGDPATNPMGWAKRPLSHLVRDGDSVNYGVVQPGEHTDDGVPLVRVGDLQHGVISRIGLKRISKEIEKAYSRSRLQGDEVLVSCVGSIGVVALAHPDCAGFNIARAVARIALSAQVDRQYLAAYLRTDHVQRYFTKELRTVSQPTLNIKQIAETDVLVPPLMAQRLFADKCEKVTGLQAVQSEALKATVDVFTSLQHRAFRGVL